MFHSFQAVEGILINYARRLDLSYEIIYRGEMRNIIGNKRTTRNFRVEQDMEK